jgi:hypothetical protein
MQRRGEKSDKRLENPGLLQGLMEGLDEGLRSQLKRIQARLKSQLTPGIDSNRKGRELGNEMNKKAQQGVPSAAATMEFHIVVILLQTSFN